MYTNECRNNPNDKKNAALPKAVVIAHLQNITVAGIVSDSLDVSWREHDWGSDFIWKTNGSVDGDVQCKYLAEIRQHAN